MEPLTAFLFAMKAAGLVTSFIGANNQEKYIRMGRQLEQAQFASNLEAVKLQSAQGSLNEMKQLRSNIGSQIAIQAARGNRGGSGYAGIEKATGAFESDEKTRRMNLLASEAELRAGHILSGMHSLQSETQLGQSLASNIFDSLQITSLLKPGLFQSKKSTTDSSSNFSWGF